MDSTVTGVGEGRVGMTQTSTTTSGPVIVAGWMDWLPEHREQGLAEIAQIFEPSRAEAGCLAYVATPDPVVPARVWIYEQWASDADLTEHFTLPHLKAFRDGIKDLTRTGQSMQKYVIASAGPVR